MFMSLDAVHTVAAVVGRDWGHDRTIISITAFGVGGALAECGSSDGGRWFVGSTRYGNSVHADTREECERLLKARVIDER